MRCYLDSRTSSPIARCAGRLYRYISITSLEGRRASMSEKTCYACVHGATKHCTREVGASGSRTACASQQKESATVRTTSLKSWLSSATKFISDTVRSQYPKS